MPLNDESVIERLEVIHHLLHSGLCINGGVPRVCARRFTANAVFFSID